MIHNLAQGRPGFTSNAFLVSASPRDADEASGERGDPRDSDRTVLVDPGNDFDVVAAVREHVDGLDAVVLTHTHPDHVGNLEDVVAAFDVEVWGYDDSLAYVDHGVADGDTVRMGEHDYEAVHTPGHKEDHLCFYAPEPGVLFAGDLVFANGGFGRTDLPEGDRPTLVDSIQRVLDRVDEDLAAMHAGHGPSVTTNPYHDVELAARAARMG